MTGQKELYKYFKERPNIGYTVKRLSGLLGMHVHLMNKKLNQLYRYNFISRILVYDEHDNRPVRVYFYKENARIELKEGS